MDSQIVVRISSEVKEKFFEVADKNDDVAAELIRSWIETYIEEHQEKDEVQIMVDVGKAMQQKLGGFNKSRFYGGKLNRALKDSSDKFVHEVTAMHTQHDMHIPSQILNVKDNTNLGYAYIIGLLSAD